MIDNYGMFYRRNKNFDLIVVRFNYELTATRYQKIGDLGVVYSDDTPIAYNFFNVHKFMKIWATNMIYLPSCPLIDVLNSVLGKDFKHLSYKESSGFNITGVHSFLSKDDPNFDLAQLVIGPRESLIVSLPKDYVQEGMYFVLAEPNIMLPNGKVTTSRHACTAYDLGISEDNTKVYELDDMYTIGSDFFRMEEN